MSPVTCPEYISLSVLYTSLDKLILHLSCLRKCIRITFNFCHLEFYSNMMAEM